MHQLTKKVEHYIMQAQSLAQSLKSPAIEPIHLLSSMLSGKDDILLRILDLCKTAPHVLEKNIEQQLLNMPKVDGQANINPSHDFLKLLDKAQELAIKQQDQFISVDQIILAYANLFPKDINLPEFNVKAAIDTIRKGKIVDSDFFEGSLDMLSKYAKDLTEMASQDKIDPVIGRDDEIRRVIQVLCRRTKNNPVLIGEPGVGKTAIAEGLALRIVRDDIPEYLRGAKLYMLDLAALVAGTQYRGEFESRMKNLLKELEDQKSANIILFIDELHVLVGAGKSEGSMDASNMLKPALARGLMRCIGATTLNEYRENIEKDAALARRFQPVYVTEPSVEDSVSILRGLKERYELHHGVRISDAALVMAAKLSSRYISDRFLPDKAIDLVDEAASRVRMRVDSRPEDIDRSERRLTQLQIEQSALSKEADAASKTRLDAIKAEIDTTKSKLEIETKDWNSQKTVIKHIRALKNEIESLRAEAQRLQRDGSNLSRAGEIMYAILPKKEEELKTIIDTNPQAAEEVTTDDIAYVVARWTGIPVEKMVEGESQKLLKIESFLKKNVIGQGKAIDVVSNAIRRARAGIKDPGRPIASFMFLGPTGVGKTELAKVLAEFLFDDRDNIVRLDMSEFMERHSVSRLIGAPPGYVGYEEGGFLTEKVRRRPYCVVLFDEIEKAHPDVFNILLQILDDGRLTDSQKRTVDFRNTIIIMTSNLGADVLMASEKVDDSVEQNVMDVVRGNFRPEFLNRLDDIIIFERLSLDNVKDIAQIEMRKLKNRLEGQGITLDYEQGLLTVLAEKGYDPMYGARPLKRVIQRSVENALATRILERPSQKAFHIAKDLSIT